MRTIITKTVALANCFALASCGSQPLEEPLEDGPVDEELDEPGDDEAEVPAGSGYEIDDVRLPHPSAFGLDLTGSPTLEPKTLVVRAERVGALEPDIVALEVTLDLDIVDDAEHPYARTLTIRGLGADCGDTGRVLLAHDSRDPDGARHPDPVLLEAIVADLALRPASSCADEPKHEPQNAGPFGPGFWAQTPCEDAQDAEFASGRALEIAIAGVLATGTPSWAAACAGHVEPIEITACENLVGDISGHLISAEVRIEASRSIIDLMDHITNEAMQLAANINLGAPGLLNAIDVAELATMALEIAALKVAADSQASIAVGHLISARAIPNLDPILEATSAPVVLGGLVVSGNTWQVDEAELTECYRRVTAWIAMVAGIGFGVRLFLPPNGLNLQLAGGSSFEEGSTILLVGPRRVQSTAYFQSNEIEVDVDQLTSEQQAMTRRENGPNVSRAISLGYEEPGYGHTLAANVMVPEPITLIPYVAAPAGAAIELGHGAYSGPSQEVPDTVYSPQSNTVYLGKVGIDLNWQETDETGTPLHPLWALCEVAPQEPLDPRYCEMSMQTTVPPWQIGQSLDRYWRIWVSGGLVDPENGAVIEPEGAQFFVSLQASAEGPVSHCWVWSSSEGEYEYQPWLEGCGPIGGGGSPGGGGGGGGGGGPSLPPG